MCARKPGGGKDRSTKSPKPFRKTGGGGGFTFHCQEGEDGGQGKTLSENEKGRKGHRHGSGLNPVLGLNEGGKQMKDEWLVGFT